MSFSDQIKNRYFDWLYDYVCKGRAHNGVSYRKLFTFLFDVEFTYIIDRDVNRAKDGVDLRYKFASKHYDEREIKYVIDILDGPCSVLEMMIALANRCEESIMTDTRYGDRTKQWFWSMLKNMGLSMMTDDRFDKKYCEDVISRFLNREYSYDGKGGLFYIPECTDDLRKLEIWTQLCWYLDGF